MNLESVAALRAATPRAAEKPSWGGRPQGVACGRARVEPYLPSQFFRKMNTFQTIVSLSPLPHANFKLQDLLLLPLETLVESSFVWKLRMKLHPNPLEWPVPSPIDFVKPSFERGCDDGNWLPFLGRCFFNFETVAMTIELLSISSVETHWKYCLLWIFFFKSVFFWGGYMLKPHRSFCIPYYKSYSEKKKKF